MTPLQDELDLVECKGKMKRWRRPVVPGAKVFNYYWKCPCGAGMRYANQNAMYDGSLKHKKECEDGSPSDAVT